MSQKNKYIYRLLSNTYFYSIFQRIMLGTSFRSKIVKKFIKKEKVNYFGYDINPNYINYAKNKYYNKGKFFCKKFSKKEIKKLPKFDHVLLLGILHHLNDEEIASLMKLIKKVLKKNGNIITEDPIFLKKQNPIAKIIITMDRGENVRSKTEYIKLIKKYFTKIKTYIYHQKFIPYTWYVMTCKN